MVKIRHIAACIAAAACTLAAPAFAQREALVGIRVPLQRNALPKQLRALALDTLNLPFFDDFAVQTSGAPNPRRWADAYVYVNNSYGVNPPTVGVATFDIADGQGRIYRHANASTFAADTLTSLPLRLQPTDENVYLSFAYQPQGNGDMPEKRDSLSLQFFSPLDSAWVNVWSAVPDTTGGSDTANVLREITHPATRKEVRSDSLSRCFFRVMLPVGAARFLHPGFRFRFISYASRLSAEVEGKESTCDMWHVDVVYLNKNRSAADSVMVDVAMQTPIARLLKEYTNMPWQHLKGSVTAQREQLVNEQVSGSSRVFTVAPKIANLRNVENSFEATYQIACVKGESKVVTHRPSTHYLPASTTRAVERNLPVDDLLNMPHADADSVAFDVRLTLSNYFVDPLLTREYEANDTCVFRQYFYPYYAYDDGSAETGYGVFGNQGNMAKVAVKFKNYRRDTLSGVYLYFNSTLDSGNYQPFRLAVWSDKNGAPDQELYVEPNCYPRFDSSLNSYAFYPLARPIVVNQDAVFYVGWIQQSTAFLNVGFDVNSRVARKNYVSLNGFSWDVSSLDGQGAIMVRPSFAKRQFDQPTAVGAGPAHVPGITVYPNPVRDELHVDIPDALREKTLRMEVFDLSGRRTLLREVAAGSAVSVAQLLRGSYLVRFSEGGRVVGFAKFIKM